MKGKMLFLFLVMLLISICVSVIGCSSGTKLKDGSYEGTATGFVGDVQVNVKVAKGKIAEVVVIKHNESMPQDSVTKLPKVMVEKNTTKVDVVSGSSVTSKAIIKAAENALVLAIPAVKSDKKSAASLFKPGTYQVTVDGHNTKMTLDVVLTDSSIVAIDVVAHGETPIVSDEAFKQVIGDIIRYQTLDVDTVAGCTVSSAAIRRAVREAVEPVCANIVKIEGKPVKAATPTNKIEETYDVVVIGGGGAGLTAAVVAAENGATVVLIEKMPSLGGNTIISGGGLNAAMVERQKAFGIIDSVENHYKQTLAAGDNIGTPELVKLLTYQAPDAVRFLEAHGYVFGPGFLTVAGGLFPRGNRPNEKWPNGTQFIQVLQDQAFKRNVVIYKETKGDELIIENGRVTGVKATRYGTQPMVLKAKKGVVLATGGFSENVELREKYNTQWPTLNASIKTTNAKGITGDGIVVAEKAGAQLIQMNHIQMLPYGHPTSGALPGLIIKDPMDCIYVNKEGKRFVSEYERRDVMTKALLNQTDSYMYIIVDKTSYPDEKVHTPFGISIAESVSKGEAVKADTIEELAIKIGVDPKTLRETVDKYNAGVASGNDEFNKAQMRPLNNPPYYANPRIPTIHHTMGGVKINANTEVLDQNNKPIPGLFAAGEVTGGIHGTNRVGGNALAEIIVFGRIAGNNVAK